MIRPSYFKPVNYKKFLFFIVCLSSLFVSFYSNSYKIVKDEKFESFDLFSESLTIGRISMSDKEGVFSKGGFPGRINDFQKNNSQDFINQPYNIYINDLNVDTEKFGVYKSQPGGQGVLYSLISRVLPFNNKTKFKIFRATSSFLSALSISLIALWCYINFGTMSSIILLILITFSPWITLFGKSLWWSLWSFYLPFASMLLYLHNKKTVPLKQLFILSYFLITLKCYLTGFEYITTFLIMISIPLFYYYILREVSLYTFTYQLLTLISASIISILSIIAILSYQFYLLTGSYAEAFKHLYLSFKKRSSGATEEVTGYIDSGVQKSLEAPYSEVFSIYWNGVSFDLTSYFNTKWSSLIQIDFGELILIFIIASLVISKVIKSKKVFALNLSLWLSIIAPLSWFVLFKGHSYIHTHLNYIVWYMPFCLYGFIVISYSLSPAFNWLKKYINKRIIDTSVITFFLIVISINISTVFLKEKNRDNIVSEIKKSKQLAQNSSPFNIYLHDDKLWYILKKDSVLIESNKFFLHMFPENKHNLSGIAKNHGFENFDFYFSDEKLLKENPNTGKRIFYIEIPNYKIKHIKTGQFNDNKRFWQTNIYLPNDTIFDK